MVADGDGDGETCEDKEEDSSDDFFDAGESAVILDRLSLRAISESGQSGGGTEDDPVTTGAGGSTAHIATNTNRPP